MYFFRVLRSTQSTQKLLSMSTRDYLFFRSFYCFTAFIIYTFLFPIHIMNTTHEILTLLRMQYTSLFVREKKTFLLQKNTIRKRETRSRKTWFGLIDKWLIKMTLSVKYRDLLKRHMRYICRRILVRFVFILVHFYII